MRESGFFVIAIGKVFSFRDDWHQDDRAHPLVRHYQAALDSILESHPELRRCLVGCAHCGIHFLTHPRNAGRTDLRCPFGCRQHHRRQRSSQRSAAYYRTPSGKAKKERLNRRRYRRSPPAAAPPPQPDPGPAMTSPTPPSSGDENQSPTDACPEKIELRLDGVVLDESSVTNSPLLPYVRMVVSLIEGIRLTCRELVGLLIRARRQHSFAWQRRIDYVLYFLHQHPP